MLTERTLLLTIFKLRNSLRKKYGLPAREESSMEDMSLAYQRIDQILRTSHGRRSFRSK
jgi:hypothetical protein